MPGRLRRQRNRRYYLKKQAENPVPPKPVGRPRTNYDWFSKKTRSLPLYDTEGNLYVGMRLTKNELKYNSLDPGVWDEYKKNINHRRYSFYKYKGKKGYWRFEYDGVWYKIPSEEGGLIGSKHSSPLSIKVVSLFKIDAVKVDWDLIKENRAKFDASGDYDGQVP